MLNSYPHTTFPDSCPLMNTKANNEIYTEDLLLQDKDVHLGDDYFLDDERVKMLLQGWECCCCCCWPWTLNSHNSCDGPRGWERDSQSKECFPTLAPVACFMTTITPWITYGQSYGQYGHYWWPACLICPAPPPPPPGWPPAARRGPGAGCRGCRGHPCRSTCTPATSTSLTSM